MKRICIVLAFILLAAVPALANTSPIVTNVVASQRSHTGLIDLVYDIVDPDGDDVHVTLWYSLDGGATWDNECVTVTGDVGPGVTAAVGLGATWDAKTDEPDFAASQFVIRVYADDGSGAVPDGFVLIPSGTFLMGSPTTEPLREANETRHQVTLTHDFWMQTTEVTNQQYADLAQWAYDNGHCTSTTSSLSDALDGSTQELLNLDSSYCEISFSGGVFSVDSGKESRPVLEVTWYGSVAYCDWLSLQQGLPRAYNHDTWQCNDHDPYTAQGYRLPTEAEWEYACRAGTQTPFNTGDCLDAGTEANYNGGYPYTGCPSGPYVGGTVPVGSYPPNAFDLYDMHGNLLEWCNDWYGDYGGTVTDPAGSSTGVSRVKRGCGWSLYAQYCRSAFRDYGGPYSSSDSVGFRPVRSAD